MSVLYLIQNDTHLKNFSTLINPDDYYINLSVYSGQNLDCKMLSHATELNLWNVQCNFYHMSPWQRLWFIFRFRQKVKNITRDHSFRKIVIGNDGALQKSIIEWVVKNDSPEVELWIDGLLSLRSYPIRNSIKLFIQKISEFMKLSFFVPSVIGFYKQIDTVFVMHESVQRELLHYRWALPKLKIKVCLFPRHELLIDKSKKVEANHNRKVLYLTSAWGFHGHSKEQAQQEKQVAELVAFFMSNPIEGVSLKIRVHPRDKVDNYKEICGEFLSVCPDFEDDLISSDVIVSIRSTSIFEAQMLHKKAFIFNKGFGTRFLNSYLSEVQSFDELNELHEAIKKTLGY